MVSYIKFLRLVKEQLPEYLPADYRSVHIEVARADKMLGRSYDGIHVYEDDSSVGVSYDLHHYYSAIDNLTELPSILRLIAAEVVDALDVRPPSIETIMSRGDYVQEHIILDVVSTANKSAMLEDIPHRIYGDIAVLFRLFYVDPAGEMYSTVVTHSLIKSMEVDLEEDEMFEIAARNTERLFPIDMKTLSGRETVPQPRRGSICNEEGDVLSIDDIDPIYTVTGHGSECFFYPDFINEVKKIIPDSFFIMPLSVVELIVIHDIGNLSLEFINEMALRIYVDEGPPEIRLTKKVYYYDDETDTLGPVEEYAHKMLQV